MKPDPKWLIKNFFIIFSVFAFFLAVSIFVSIMFADLYEMPESMIPECSYLIFLAGTVIRIFWEQKKDMKGDSVHYKQITVLYAVLNMVSYVVLNIIMYIKLRNGPIVMFTRFYKQIPIYDLIYLNITKSAFFASVLDCITVVALIFIANYIAYSIYSRQLKVSK